MTPKTPPKVCFTASSSFIDDAMIVALPPDASTQLPSRGQVAVEGTVDGQPFETVVEPDGRRGHWLRVDGVLADALKRSVSVGGDHLFEIEVADAWPEPDVPNDLAAELSAAPAEIRAMWEDITPMARWEWVRWVQATANPATRRRRVEVTISKMANGKRRPCCFDLSACTDPQLARSGKLRTQT